MHYLHGCQLSLFSIVSCEMNLLEFNFNIDPTFFSFDEIVRGEILFSNKKFGYLSVRPVTNQHTPSLPYCPPKIVTKRLHNKPVSRLPEASKRLKPEMIHPPNRAHETVVADQVLLSPNVSASDMIKTMQDSETRKKMFYCICCTYESSHHGTMKRHVEAKHLPQSVTFNCLQCPKTFSVKSGLKRHYMNFHGLFEAAAKTMLPS